jgi:hypothetical protein
MMNQATHKIMQKRLSRNTSLPLTGTHARVEPGTVRRPYCLSQIPTRDLTHPFVGIGGRATTNPFHQCLVEITRMLLHRGIFVALVADRISWEQGSAVNADPMIEGIRLTKMSVSTPNIDQDRTSPPRRAATQYSCNGVYTPTYDAL